MLKGDPRLRSKAIYERLTTDFPAGGIVRETALDQIPKATARALRSFSESSLAATRRMGGKHYVCWLYFQSGLAGGG
jgi:hypothetical protein